jgi:(hydroxyamino)benzene mutase
MIRSLIVAGAVLFLIGLLQGAFVQSFANSQMALSAHLAAVQSGMALMIVGAIWSAVLLGGTLAKAAQWAIIIGMYGLWLGLTLSAATGASETLSIAGAGHRAAPITETAVSTIVLGSSGLMTIGWLVFVVGLIRSKRTLSNVATPNSDDT